MLNKRFSISIQYGMILCLLFLAAINFDAKFYYFAFAAALAMMVFLWRFRMNAVSTVYLALGLLMGVFHASYDVLAAIRPLSYFLVYLVGFNIPCSSLAKRGGKREQDVAYQLLMTVALGSFAHLMLNFILNMGKDLGRNTVDIWSGQIMAATGQAALGCIMIGVAAAMIIAPNKKHSRLWGVLFVVGIMSYNLTLAGRTMVIMLALCFAVGGLYMLTKDQLALSRRVKILFRMLLLIVILLGVYEMDLGGIRGFVEDSNLYQRFFGDTDEGVWETGRWAAKLLYLKNMVKYPFGGLHMREQCGHAHDLLLDAYDEFGIIALLLLLIVLIDGIRQVYLFCKNAGHKPSYRVGVLCAYVAILMQFCVEPIFAGMPWLFVCYSLLNAALTSANRAAKEEKVRMMAE